jgi:propionyl-CoA carboxylase alpha chain
VTAPPSPTTGPAAAAPQPSERPFERLLVANRGEIACRVVAATHARGVAAVAVHSDADAHARHVELADLAVRLPGTAPADTYLRADLLLDAARRAGADAVHPGYGFLAEDAGFAEAVLAAGLVWVGPPPAAMRAMATKREARALVAAAGVPVLPAADVPVDAEGRPVPATLAAAGAAVGYPLLVKASAGGGGRGMRRVDGPADLAAAVAAARREAASAFGDPTVFLERFVAGARHVEVQVLADGSGTVLHLGERDCSVQRRHQKVLEEAPAPGLPAALRAALAEAALTVARTVGYRSLGTVEMLIPPDAGTFWFLEMNTRVQVEHPVTEQVTGLDLVALQLAVAAGEPLRIAQDDVRVAGHAVEVRLVAEDPERGWLPSTGELLRFDPPAVAGVRWDTGVRAGDVVGPHYDSLLAKVVAHGATRDEALRRLRRALSGLRLHGVRTNRDAMLALLGSEPIVAGRASTDLLDRRPELLRRPLPVDVRDRLLAAAVLADVPPTVPGGPPPGWRTLGGTGGSRTLRLGDGSELVVRWSGSLDATQLRVGERAVAVRRLGDRRRPTASGADVSVDVEVDGLRFTALVAAPPADPGADRWFDVDGLDRHVRVCEPARLPLPAGAGADGTGASPAAPVPGTVVAVAVRSGDEVEAGQPLVVLEAMKMEHRLLAGHAGVVREVRVRVGDALQAHDVPVLVEPHGGAT